MVRLVAGAMWEARKPPRWDRLGWRDPYLSPAFSARQSNYDTRVFHAPQVYTPQFVIDGRLERVGGDARAVERAIEQAATSPKAAVTEVALPHVTSAGRIEDISVVSFRASRQIVFLAGDVAQADLIALAKAVAEPLYRELAGV